MGVTTSITKDNLKIKFSRIGFKSKCIKNQPLRIEVLKSKIEIILEIDSIQIIGLYSFEYSFFDIKGFNIFKTSNKLYLNILLMTGEQNIIVLPLKTMSKYVLKQSLSTVLFLREVKKGEKIYLKNEE